MRFWELTRFGVNFDLIAGLYTSLGTHLFQSKIRLTQILTHIPDSRILWFTLFHSPDNRFKFAKILDGRQKNKWPIVIKAFETCTGEAKRVIASTVYHHHFTVYGVGAAPLSKPHEHSFRVGARGNGSLFRVRKVFFPREKHKTANKMRQLL